MGTELTTARQAEVGIYDPPETTLANAMTAAKALQTVIAGKKKPVIMNGEQYLEFEDWQTCGQFYGLTVGTHDAVPVEIDGVKGAKARADLVDLRTGQVIEGAGAEAYCMRDEEKWNTRPKYEWQGEGDDRHKVKVGDEVVPWFQLASMAQTRAGAKAFRNRLAWVVVLAGYRPTPAEEMTGNEGRAEPVMDKTHHSCTVHHVPFFKKGKMKSYAHKIEGTDQWCNEPEAGAATATVEKPTTAPPAGVVIEGHATEAPAPATSEQAFAGIPSANLGAQPSATADPVKLDMDWVKSSLNALGWNTVLKWIAEHYHVTGSKVSEIVPTLTDAQKKDFMREINERLAMI
jgi:hypothetical protein